MNLIKSDPNAPARASGVFARMYRFFSFTRKNHGQEEDSVLEEPISEQTLKGMDEAMANFQHGNVSPPVNLRKFDGRY